MHELRAWYVCVGYKAFAFVVSEFDILSAVTMCPMAGKYRLANRLLVSLIFCQLSLCVQWQESIGWRTDC